MSKYFVINPNHKSIGKKRAELINQKNQHLFASVADSHYEKNKDLLSQHDNLNYVHGRIVIKVDTEAKNFHTFDNGIKIRRERQFNEMNRRITEPVNAYVISAEHIPEGAEVLISHNALHDSNRVFNYKNASETSDIKYFSIKEDECFAWRDTDGEMKPMNNVAFALRVYHPYTGVIEGILPTQIKDVLYITTGELKGKVVHTLKASDYEIIYQGESGKEERIIRVRHFEEDNDREEVIAVSGDLTEKVNDCTLLVGLSESNCKTLK